MRTVLAEDAVSNHPAGQQIQNYTEIERVCFNLEIGDVATPDLIYSGYLNILAEQSSLLIFLPFFEVLLCIFLDTDEI